MSDTTVGRASGPTVAEEVEMQHDNSGAQAPGATPSTSPIPSRRRLLKAASSMPLVATLPSGAALANASSLQCIINEQNAEFDPLETPGARPLATPNPDTYIRITGRIQKWTLGGPEYDPSKGLEGPGFGQTVDIYVYTIDQQQITIIGDHDFPGVAPPGTWFYPTTQLQGANFDHVYNPRSDALELTEFLYVYQSTGGSNNAVGVSVDSNPSSQSYGEPTDCDLAGTPQWPGTPPTGVACQDSNGNPIACPGTPAGPNVPAHCVWPLARPVTDASQGGNIPLTASCLASFGR